MDQQQPQTTVDVGEPDNRPEMGQPEQGPEVGDPPRSVGQEEPTIPRDVDRPDEAPHPAGKG